MRSIFIFIFTFFLCVCVIPSQVEGKERGSAVTWKWHLDDEKLTVVDAGHYLECPAGTVTLTNNTGDELRIELLIWAKPYQRHGFGMAEEMHWSNSYLYDSSKLSLTLPARKSIQKQINVKLRKDILTRQHPLELDVSITIVVFSGQNPIDHKSDRKTLSLSYFDEVPDDLQKLAQLINPKDDIIREFIEKNEPSIKELTEERDIAAKLFELLQRAGFMDGPIEIIDLPPKRLQHPRRVLQSKVAFSSLEGCLLYANLLASRGLQVALAIDSTNLSLVLFSPKEASQTPKETIVWEEQIAKLEQALRIYKTIDGTELDQAGCYQNIGIALLDMGKYEEAIEKYQQAIRILKIIKGSERELADCYMNIGVALLNMGKYNETIAKLEHALSIYKTIMGTEREQANCYMNISVALDKIGQSEEAIEKYEQALRIFQTTTGTDWLAVDIRSLAGSFEKAVETGQQQYQQWVQSKEQVTIIELNEAWKRYPPIVLPTRAEMEINLKILKGIEAAQNGDWDEAKQIFLQILKQAIQNPAVHNNLGNFYLYKGQIDVAIEQYEKAIKYTEDSGKTDVRLYLNLGIAYYHNRSEYQHFLDKACEGMGGNFSNMRAALGFRIREEQPEIWDLLAAAVERYTRDKPDYPEFRGAEVTRFPVYWKVTW